MHIDHPDFAAQTMNIGDRIKALREKLHLTQEEMAARLKVSRNYIWQLEAGTKPGGPKLERDVELMEKSPMTPPPTAKRRGDIIDVEVIEQSPISALSALVKAAKPALDIMRDVSLSALRYIPVLSWAEAGRIIVAFDEMPENYLDKMPTDVHDPLAMGIEIRGNSMEPIIFEGDRVICLPSQEPRNGDIVVAKLANDGIVLKLYHETDNGKTIHLASFNPLYPPKTYQRSELERIVPVDSVLKKVRH